MRVNNAPRHQLACGKSAPERIAVVGPTLEQQREIIALYRQRGATQESVARATYWSATTVGRVLHAWGEPVRKRGGRTPYLSTEEHLLTCELYGQGFTIEEIATMRGRAEESIRQRLLRNGVQLRPVGFVQGTRVRRRDLSGSEPLERAGI